MELTINVDATDKTLAAVVSASDRTPLTDVELLVIDNLIPLTLSFCDDDGAVPSWVTDAGTTLAVGLGNQDVSGSQSFTSTTIFSIVGSTRVGELSLNTGALRNALANKLVCARGSQTRFVMEVRKKIAATGALQTLALLQVFVAGKVLPVDPLNPEVVGTAITSLTGDVTASGPGAAVATLASTGVTPGSYGSSTSIPSFTVDAKGRLTAVASNAVVAPAVTITDDTTTNATMYPTWVTAATGNLPVKVASTKLTFNPSAGLLTLPRTSLTEYLQFTNAAVPTTPAVGSVLIGAVAAASGVSRLVMFTSTGAQLAFFRDSVLTARNETGSTITKGQVVYISGANGTTSTIGLAKSDAASTCGVIGVALANIANNAFGTVQRTGLFTEVNTLAFTAGDMLFVSPTTAGAVTNVRPTAPNFAMQVGTVVLSSANGILDLFVQSYVPELSNKFIVQGTADQGLTGAQFLGALGTGIVKNTTTTGVLSIAVAGDFPTLNQDTTGSAGSVPASGITGTTLASNVVSSSLATVGVLTGGSINWTGAITTTGLITGQPTIAANTSGNGLVLTNPNAATNGNQRHSPAIELGGYAWDYFTASSKAQKFRIYAQSVQFDGDGSPLLAGKLLFEQSVNGGAWTPYMTMTDGGVTFSGIVSASVIEGVASFNASNIYAAGSLTADITTLGVSGGTVSIISGLGLGLLEINAGVYFVRLNAVDSTIDHDCVIYFDPKNGDRTLTLTDSPTLGDWFNQSVKTTASPSFSAVTATTFNGTLAGSAATLTTPRAIYGNNFNGSAALTQIIASTYGGTGNGFTKFTGPATAERTFTLPNADATLLYSGGALGTPSSGTVTNLTGTASININGTVGATTPNTGAFTTLSATAPLTLTGTTVGSSSALWVGSDSVGGLFLNAPSGQSVRLGVANTGYAVLSSTGLAVTGALSATGAINTTQASGLIQQSASDTSLLTLLGGTGSASSIQIFGGTHAGFPKQIYYKADNHYLTTQAGSIRAEVNSTGLAVTGVISTTDPVGGAGPNWKLGQYTAGVAVQAGKVRIDIGGTPYDLLTA